MFSAFRSTLYRIAPFLLALGTSPLLQAQDVFTGTYTGTLDGQEFCPDGGGGPGSTELTFTVTVSDTAFTGEGTFTDLDDGSTGTFTLEGTGSASSTAQVSGDVLAVDPEDDVTQSGHFEGTFNDDFTQLNLQVFLVDDGPPNCEIQGSGTFTLVEEPLEDGVVNPEETASSVVTAPVILKTQVQAISTSLNARISDIVRGIGGGPRVTANGVYQGISGLAAGEGGPSYGVWASYSYSDFDNDFAATLLDGHRHNVLAGADMTPRDNMVLGVAFGYEFASIDTKFNGGDQDTDGFTIAPYFGLLLSDNWNVSATVGYSSLDTDQFRTDALGNRVTSNPDSDRWFGTLNLNGYTTWNDWLFTGRIGMLQARNIQESFDESDGTAVGRTTTELGQWNVGGEAAYSWGEFEPFARVTYENDYSLSRITIAGTGPQPSRDDDNWLFGLGLRYFSSDNGLSGNIEWYKRLGREDYDEDTFTATVRWEF